MEINKHGSAGSKTKTMRLKEEVINMIERRAEQENRTFTNMVETILMRDLEML
ncbi:MAG: hypothetical protein AAF487_03080 [Bacteroidota bacterium]